MIVQQDVAGCGLAALEGETEEADIRAATWSHGRIRPIQFIRHNNAVMAFGQLFANSTAISVLAATASNGTVIEGEGKTESAIRPTTQRRMRKLLEQALLSCWQPKPDPLNTLLDGMRQRRFDHAIRKVGRFARPVAEGRSKPVRRVGLVHVAQNLH